MVLLNEGASARTLAMARILVFSLWIWNLNVIRLPDYGLLPSDLLNRYGVLRLIPDFAWEVICTTEFLTGFQLVVLGCLVWLVLGLPRYSLVAIPTCIMLTFFDGMAKSIGHINHAKFGILFAAWILAAFPAADALALAKRRGPLGRRSQYVAPMVMIPGVLLIAYGFMGAFRIDGNGLDLFQSEALQYWFARNSFLPNVRGFQLGIAVAEMPLLLIPMQIGFGVLTFMELLAPLCLVSKHFRWAWLAVLVPFHFLSVLLLNIFFWQNILLILFFMTDIDRWIESPASRAMRLGDTSPMEEASRLPGTGQSGIA